MSVTLIVVMGFGVFFRNAKPFRKYLKGQNT